MPLHIGLVACSAEGAALCYRTICVEGASYLGAHAHPEVSMHTHSLAEYMDRIYRGDWEGVGELMLASAVMITMRRSLFSSFTRSRRSSPEMPGILMSRIARS